MGIIQVDFFPDSSFAERVTSRVVCREFRINFLQCQAINKENKCRVVNQRLLTQMSSLHISLFYNYLSPAASL